MIFLGDNITFQCAVVMRINYLTRVTEARRVYGIMGGKWNKNNKDRGTNVWWAWREMLWNARERKRKQKQKRRPWFKMYSVLCIDLMLLGWRWYVVVVIVDQSRWWESVTPVMRSSDNVKNWGTPKEEEEWKGGGERSREVRRESIGISQYKGYITNGRYNSTKYSVTA